MPLGQLLLAGIGLLAMAVCADSSALQIQKQKHEALRQKISRLQESIAQTRTASDQLSKTLERIEIEMAAVGRRLHTTKKSLAKLENEHQALLARQTQLHKQIQSAREKLADVLRAAYIVGRQARLKLLLSQNEPREWGRLLTYYDYLQAQQAQQLASFLALLRQVRDLGQRLQEKKIALQRLQAAMEAQRSQLQAKHRERKALLDRMHRELSTKEQALRRLQEDAHYLEQLIQSIQDAVWALDLPEHERFETRKGKLPWPLRGKLQVRFGARKAGSLKWEGVIIQAQEGDEVHAVHAGRVAYADWLRGYGLLLILDHGDGYMTLYGHNQSLFKEIGDWVERGELIGLAGRSGGQAKSGVYFAIRHAGKALNPEQWWMKN